MSFMHGTPSPKMPQLKEKVEPVVKQHAAPPVKPMNAKPAFKTNSSASKLAGGKFKMNY